MLTFPVREGTALGWLELVVSVEVALQGIPTGVIFAPHVEGQADVAEAVQTLKRTTADGEVEGYWALGARALQFDVGIGRVAIGRVTLRRARGEVIFPTGSRSPFHARAQ